MTHIFEAENMRQDAYSRPAAAGPRCQSSELPHLIHLRSYRGEAGESAPTVRHFKKCHCGESKQHAGRCPAPSRALSCSSAGEGVSKTLFGHAWRLDRFTCACLLRRSEGKKDQVRTNHSILGRPPFTHPSVPFLLSLSLSLSLARARARSRSRSLSV